MGRKRLENPTLQQMRLRASLTQVDVADHIEVDAQQVSRWERGLEVLPERHVGELAQLYDVTTDEIRDWVYGPVQTARHPENWRDHILLESDLSSDAIVALFGVSAFRDAERGVCELTKEALWTKVRIPEAKRDDVWEEILESGFVRRVGDTEWSFELVYPY